MYNLTKADAKAITLCAVDSDTLTRLTEESDQLTANQLKNQQFKAKFGSVAHICTADGNLSRVLVGIQKTPRDPRVTVQLFAALAEQLPAGVYCLEPHGWSGFDGDQAALGWGLACYHFANYLKDKPKEWPTLAVPAEVDLPSVTHRLDGIFLARDMINTPAADMGPEHICEQAQAVAEAAGAQITITTGKDLERSFPAIYAVGMGSHRPSALIDIRWGDKSHPAVTLVGKGVAFDSGGLNLKQPTGMRVMKKDMGGSAVILGLAQLVMAEKLAVNLRVLIPTVENAIGPKAYRPGDVVQTRKGLTVEIGNTDAEGRMILCDALALATEENPDLIVDMATLTGACRVALGQDLPGFYSPNDALAAELTRAASNSGDPLWHMPLWYPYRMLLKSKISDMNNIASSSLGGSITAALFLHDFVKPFENWLHLDIYGWRLDSIPGTPLGGEANGLRAVFRLLADRYPQQNTK